MQQKQTILFCPPLRLKLIWVALPKVPCGRQCYRYNYKTLGFEHALVHAGGEYKRLFRRRLGKPWIWWGIRDTRVRLTSKPWYYRWKILGLSTVR